MKRILIIPLIALLSACGGSGAENSGNSSAPGQVKLPTTLAEAEADFAKYNGIGPISSFDLPADINQDLVSQGKEVYENMCTACHKEDEKFIGPAPKGILERRTPAWVMNMILNPEQMLSEDPIAKLLYIEYNLSPMANQNLTEDQARAVLEYFRTL